MTADFEVTASGFSTQHSSAEFDVSDERPDLIDDESESIAWDDFLGYCDEVRS